jgi:hypothetical protein
MAGMLPRDVGTCIAVNLILNGSTEFILTPGIAWSIVVFIERTSSILLVKTGGLELIKTVAISL